MRLLVIFAVLARFGAAALAALLLAAPAAAHDLNAMGSDGPAGAMSQMGKRMEMGAHMTMTDPRPATAEDIARARELLKTLREALVKYQDYKVAMAAGFVPFLPNIPQEVYHFTNYSYAYHEYHGDFDLARPGSLLYARKAFGGYRLVGAMYSAPANLTLSELDERVPLSIARWHQHTNICLPDGITLGDLIRGDIGAQNPHVAEMLERRGHNPSAAAAYRRYGFMADGRFGFRGTIADPAECEAAGGHFLKVAFGWMVHVYPFTGDDLKVAFGTKVP